MIIEQNLETTCKGCQKEFERLLGHLRYNEDCRNKYTEEEIENLRGLKRQLQNARGYTTSKKMKIMVKK